MRLAPLIPDLKQAAREAGFVVQIYGQVGNWPLLAMTRRGQTPGGRNIYLSAGIHGDEPAGPFTLLKLLQAGTLPAKQNYWICPLLNPAGLAAGTREEPGGLDLNRDYSGTQSREIRAHIAWANQHINSLDLSLHLHEDWESRGFYCYELNLTGKPGCARAILRAARHHLPIETAGIIDGHLADGGIIHRDSLPKIPEGDPEAIFLQQNFGGLSYTLETPSAFPLEKRVAGMEAAVLSALSKPDQEKWRSK